MLLSRAPVAFATGAATRVRGMRWFRDPQRNDIQHELPGWPEGPSYTARSTGSVVAHKSLKAAAMAGGAAILAFLSSAGGNISGSGHAKDESSDTPDEPADEVDDFPVMWAEAGTLARTLPWQLDPGRADEKHYRTHLIVTSRRLVVVGLPYHKKNLELIDDELLWECPRSNIQSIELKNFKDGYDFKVQFVDGSWCRLSSVWRASLMRYLVPPRELIPLESLTPQQRATVEDFAAQHQMPEPVSPIVARNPTGRMRVDILLPSNFTSAFGASEVTMTMDTSGRKVDIDDFLPEDF
jgi:hypothetical protein